MDSALDLDLSEAASQFIEAEAAHWSMSAEDYILALVLNDLATNGTTLSTELEVKRREFNGHRARTAKDRGTSSPN